jgi:Anti-sigma-K factor rskA
MTNLPPDFDELVGDGVGGPERDRLRRVHDLLVAAGPPPELSSETAPATNVVALRPRRRRGALLGVAAALAAAAIFTIGLVVAAGDDPSAERVVAMTGPSGAHASLEIFALDDAGNWPMLVEVEGLAPAANGELYELWLTVDGALAALCGSFRTDPEGRAVIPMNAPWKIDDFDGWVVVAAGSTRPLLST